ncbi:MAG TPA: ABC transporter permease [Acidimicrobiia bacterium]|nr:ABC transporter permease [Acidimicrobiia bacterium]
MTLDSIRVALRGVFANRLRSALTMLGILIGTAAVILLVGVGRGISDGVQNQIKSLGTNALYVIPERNAHGRDRGGTSARRIRLTANDVKALQDKVHVPDAAVVTPQVSTSGTVTWNGTTYALNSFIGAEPAFADVRNATVDRGRLIDDEDVRDHAKVGIIGATVVDHLMGPGFDPVGQMVEFNGIRLRIIGELTKKGSNGFQDQDDVIIAPLPTVIDNIVGNVDSYSSISIQATSRDTLPAAQQQVTRTLRRTHHIRGNQPPDFIVFNAANLLAAGKAAAKSFQLLLAVVAAISLLIGGIGVMNIMLVTVTERTREIGIRKALGAQRGDILSQFLVEAMILAGLGGILGVAIGIGAGQYHGAGLNPNISPTSVVMSFGVSILIGIFFGIYPASRAAALTPMEALRYE